MSENLKTYFANILKLLKDTFTGEIHSNEAIKQFDKLIEETKNIEDFDHENRIYVLEGKINEIIKTVNFIATYYKTDDPAKYIEEVRK